MLLSKKPNQYLVGSGKPLWMGATRDMPYNYLTTKIFKLMQPLWFGSIVTQALAITMLFQLLICK